MCFKWFVKQKYGIEPPYPLDDISFNELHALVTTEFPDAQIYLSDSKYKTTSVSQLSKFLTWDKTNEREYVSEWFDCDDYSYVLTGDIKIPGWEELPFGMLWTETPDGGHAVNVFVDNEKKVWIIEPQNDSIKKLPTGWKPYLVII